MPAVVELRHQHVEAPVVVRRPERERLAQARGRLELLVGVRAGRGVDQPQPRRGEAAHEQLHARVGIPEAEACARRPRVARARTPSATSNGSAVGAGRKHSTPAPCELRREGRVRGIAADGDGESMPARDMRRQVHQRALRAPGVEVRRHEKRVERRGPALGRSRSARRTTCARWLGDGSGASDARTGSAASARAKSSAVESAASKARPGRAISRCPPTSAATTGSPAASASAVAMESPSWRLTFRTASQAAYQGSTGSTKPGRRSQPATPRVGRRGDDAIELREPGRVEDAADDHEARLAPAPQRREHLDGARIVLLRLDRAYRADDEGVRRDPELGPDPGPLAARPSRTGRPRVDGAASRPGRRSRPRSPARAPRRRKPPRRARSPAARSTDRCATPRACCG